MTLLKIILAVILPPAAAFMQVGLTVHFALSILLTICAWVPGMIHAIWLIATDKRR